MPDLSELIERIEAASEGSRELDALIHFSVDGKWIGRLPTWPPSKVYRPAMETGLYMVVEGDGYFYGDSVPHYTASIDAAMTLAPQGDDHWPQIIYTSTNPNNAHRQMDRAEIWVKGRSKANRGHARTPALALCAAALKAHQTKGDAPNA